ncbi:hypothetical protein [Streptomyces sp. SCSIO ZS0520]|uniref:hypothetical protein n=1 Tax=Streptomyces sp. SCSIO ZS0520 TaxID=2892996 RepID=UPI0021D91B18|nr:hypothetical protein [Streptomyces sp. SCSIO ZS0520]
MARITTPVPGYSGPGPAGVMFQDGTAESDDPAVLAYCEAAGYGIDGDPPEREQPTVPDPREVTTQVVGSPVRDAAVDPLPSDFRPPVNAGEANPHGPEVYAPGLPGGGHQPTAPAAEPHPAGAPAGGGRPPQSEPVAVWREYAAGVATSEEERAEVEKMTKAELIKKYGG